MEDLKVSLMTIKHGRATADGIQAQSVWKKIEFSLSFHLCDVRYGDNNNFGDHSAAIHSLKIAFYAHFINCKQYRDKYR